MLSVSIKDRKFHRLCMKHEAARGEHSWQAVASLEQDFREQMHF